MYTYTIAARYTFRRLAPIAAIILVAIIVTLYLTVISVLEGFKNQFMDKIQNIMAHITIDVGNYAGGIVHPKEWSEEIMSFDTTITGVTVGIETPAMALFPKARTIGTLRGIDLDQELKYGRLKDILKPKDLADFRALDSKGKPADGCIVGGLWRKAYNLKMNQRINFFFTDESDEMQSKAFTIVGFYEGENPYLENGAYIDRKLIADLLQVGGRAKTLYVWVSNPNREDLKDFKLRLKEKMRGMQEREEKQLAEEILVELSRVDKKMADAASRILQRDDLELREKSIVAMSSTSAEHRDEKILADKIIELLRKKDDRLAFRIIEILNREERTEKINVETWQEKDNYFYETITSENRIMRAIMFIFLLLTGFMLLLIFNGIVTEKIRDIGALRALGASPAGIQKCFLMQAIFIAGLGIAIGMALSPLLLFCLNYYPLLRNLFYPNLDLIPHNTLAFDRIAITVSTVLSSLGGAAFPAWRASRMNPVECLRHE